MIKDLVVAELKKLQAYKEKTMSCIVWGCKEKSLESVRWIMNHTEYKLIGLADNDKEKWNKCYNIGEGEMLKCYPPSEIDFEKCIVFCGMHLPTCLKVIDQLGIENAFPIETAVYENRWSEIEQIIDGYFDDDESKESYCAILYYRMTGDSSYMQSLYKEDQYFYPKAFQIGTFSLDNDIFVDCGAYCGDTIEKYIYKCEGIFKTIYGFEIGEKQFEAMQIRCRRLKQEWALEDNQIKLYPEGVGDENTRAYLSSGVTESKASMRISSSGTSRCSIVKLDDILLQGATFIKMDIEGYELKALKGAFKVIKEYQPRLAISIYHGVTDMIDIPVLIKSINHSYKMALAIHSNSDVDGVLYCWIDGAIGGNYPGIFEI